jgi:hypothetical protein
MKKSLYVLSATFCCVFSLPVLCLEETTTYGTSPSGINPNYITFGGQTSGVDPHQLARAAMFASFAAAKKAEWEKSCRAIDSKKESCITDRLNNYRDDSAKCPKETLISGSVQIGADGKIINGNVNGNVEYQPRQTCIDDLVATKEAAVQGCIAGAALQKKNLGCP